MREAIAATPRCAGEALQLDIRIANSIPIYEGRSASKDAPSARDNLNGLPLVVPYEATNSWDSQASGVFAVDVALGRSDQHDCGHTILPVFQRGRCTVLAALH